MTPPLGAAGRLPLLLAPVALLTVLGGCGGAAHRSRAALPACLAGPGLVADSSLASPRSPAAAPGPGARELGAAPSPSGPSPPTGPGPTVMIRVNQLGYTPGCPKQAFAMSDHPLDGGRFQVLEAGGPHAVFQGGVGARRPAVNSRWRYVYTLDLGPVRRPGRYVLALDGARSPSFQVAPIAQLYAPLVSSAVSYYQQQRDGPDVIPGPLHRQASHLADASALHYAVPRFRGTGLAGSLVSTGRRVDASGGWFDAGDYLKFVETASFDEVAMLFSLREYGAGIPDQAALRGEARFGLDWLLRMWDQRRGVLYDQVGVGDGDGRVLGDHDLWRLPQADAPPVARRSPRYFLVYRPVFAANAPGQRISPNLAGRTAAAFALCAQVFAASDPGYARRCLEAGQRLYDLADAPRHGRLTTTEPYLYYPELEWRDDMELGASELFLATRQLSGGQAPTAGGPGAGAGGRLPHPNPDFYVPRAARWADAYLASANNGGDSLNLYDVGALAHFELARILSDTTVQRVEAGAGLPVDPRALVADLRDQLRLATTLSAGDPFGLSDPASPVDTVPHALGFAIEARLWDALTRTGTYERLSETELNWAFGANPWGTSFTVGAGQVYPHCLAHPIANLSGSLTGQGAILRGATTDGPTSLANVARGGAPDGVRPCPSNGVDPFAGITAGPETYRDDVRSFATSEPSNDYAALVLLASAQAAAGG